MNDTNHSIETLTQARNAAVRGVRMALARKDAESERLCREYIERMDRAILAKGGR